MKRLAIVITHPVQYYSPIFKLLTKAGKIKLKVFYTWEKSSALKYDPGFGKDIEWDIPLLEGYEYTFVKNVSKKPDSNHFNGIDNPTLIQEILEWKADYILFFGWNYKSHLKAMRYFKGKIPVYFRGDSTLLDERQGLKLIARRIFLRWVYNTIDFAFYVGTRNKEYFLAHGLKNKQLIFAPHAVDNERFCDKNGNYKRKAIDWRQSIGIKDDEFVFLFAGKLEPKKNPMLLLDAFIKLNNPKTHLLFVGNGVLENELKARINAMQSHSYTSLHKNIHLIDFQNQSVMPVIYRLGNVYILPSQGPGETWGLAVNEAIACGLPVIASDKVGCTIDLIKNGVNGFIFRDNNEGELINALKNSFELCTDEKFISNLLNMFSISQCSNIFIKCFNE